MTAAEIVALLKLEPHPEGGWFRETFRDAVEVAPARAASTAIHYLLEAGQQSHWHRVTDAAEVWSFNAGGPLELAIAMTGEAAPVRHLLGADLTAGERPHVVVPPNAWQAARPTGDWTLVTCTVAPGFIFDRFEMAPPDWTPGKGDPV
jgi:uncharacterized protein